MNAKLTRAFPLQSPSEKNLLERRITAAYNSFRILCDDQENIWGPLNINGDDRFRSAVNSITRFPYDISNIILSWNLLRNHHHIFIGFVNLDN